MINICNNNNKINRKFIECFQWLKTICKLKKNMQHINTHTKINDIKNTSINSETNTPIHRITCNHTHTHACTHAHTHTHTYTHAHTHTHAHTLIALHAHVCTMPIKNTHKQTRCNYKGTQVSCSMAPIATHLLGVYCQSMHGT